MVKFYLKYRTSNGKCTHKKNNHRDNNGLMDCHPKHCQYFEECKLTVGEQDSIFIKGLFDVLKQ